MPLPWTAIDRLSDHFGQYTVCVTCLRCQHAGEHLPASLAKRYGWNTPMSWIVARLKCPQCKKKRCKVEIAFDEKPRGWVKNPA
jgi:hypothetical protein